ncbi:related to 3' exoribonuclease family protein [Cephalotrichum gorgonifer]|uniref:Related to 3' exoribonuclease family protein n=1 Tax=Cephalotrichum gorgonifer TaxID=2041049 RepID=A0AAE8MXN0_9PEZI|nr:related to 3' exoribonuclease family protein [Cephalotrichum gorgonifer]
MADRRRINGPPGATRAPVFRDVPSALPARTRPANAARGVFLKTGVTPSASGSAYLEFAAPPSATNSSATSGMKLTCTVHGPRALPRSSPFSPHLVLTTHVKFAPFATRQRRGYVRDTSERDLSVHLETALRAAVLADRWPKSGVDVIVTIVEGDYEAYASQSGRDETWDLMNVLGACITVASAAVIDAGIDCIDSVTGGVAAFVSSDTDDTPVIILDPALSESPEVLAACCVAYLPSRDEISAVWLKGQLPSSDSTANLRLIGMATQAAKGISQPLLGGLSECLS